MTLNQILFWDTDVKKIDFQKNSRSIIERIITRGTINDWYELKKFYGLKKIKDEVINIPYLDKITLNFLSKYFSLPVKKFKCYNTKQYTKKLWNY